MTRAAHEHPDEPVSTRRPVGHPGTTRHLTVLVVAFVVTVTVTRIFLAATGYPRIGGATFHLAHALWGGLLLTVAAGRGGTGADRALGADLLELGLHLAGRLLRRRLVTLDAIELSL